MSLARLVNLETLDKSQFMNFYIYPYLIAPDPKRHFWSKMSRQLDFLIYFWASLSVDGTARASITGTSRLDLNEQTLSLLLSFVSGILWNLCSISFLAVLVELYLTSINFN